nr:MAG TPA: hypothetical protein [Caudoviricetes sp.]
MRPNILSLLKRLLQMFFFHICQILGKLRQPMQK